MRPGTVPSSPSSADADARRAEALWIGWRLRLLVLAALAGCVGLFLVAATLTQQPHVPGTWKARDDGGIELAHATAAPLSALRGQRLEAVRNSTGERTAVDALLLQHSPRWLVDDDARQRQSAMAMAWRAAVHGGTVQLEFADGRSVAVEATARGVAGLGMVFWLLAALALVLYLIGMVVLLARPQAKNLLFMVMALAQATNVAWMAAESVPGLGFAGTFYDHGGTWRMGCDLVTAAAVLHASAVHPRLLARGLWWAAAGWGAALTLVALSALGKLPDAWLWTQAAMLALGAGAVLLLGRSAVTGTAHPLAIVLRRFGIAALGTLALLTLAIVATEHQRSLQYNVAAVGSVIWYVFLASLLLLLPFMSRSQQLLREFSLLAGVSTVATSLDLLFVAVFSLGQFASLTLSLFLALGVYAGVRQWVLNQMTGRRTVTTERMFEQLYRAARRIEARPEESTDAVADLLRALFEPIELNFTADDAPRSRVAADGASLWVPMPASMAAAAGGDVRRAVAMRFAGRGKRLFTEDDARLADRIVDQLARAVAHDKAVELGRHEERVRIAQDLHDDIGARLLTLMYKAPTPEMEDYLRHTLQDLKTLTRGLAAPSHRLSHAAAEWKADLAQRLSAAGCDLGWSFSADRDIALSVVQWSALTRILRELVTNTMAHAMASRVDIDGQLVDGALRLTVTDNGIGRDPQSWSHGLGLGGVRKRAKQLGGTVEWAEVPQGGIRCTVRIPQLTDRP